MTRQSLRLLTVLLMPLLLVSGLVSRTVYAAVPPPTPGAAVEPASGTVGTTFTFSFDRWIPGEEVTYWVVGPGSPRAFEEGRFVNDPGGNGRTEWTWTVPPGTWSGIWTMNAEGLRSEVAVEIPFELVVENPRFVSGVRPQQGPPGTVFEFYTDAWPEGDVVDTWVLPPGSEDPFFLGRIYGDPDPQGLTFWEWEAPPNVWGGTWTMNARGFWSERFVQIPFTIVGPPPPPPATAGVAPGEGYPGATLTFTATGFTGGEEVAYWVNAPGEERPVASGKVDEVFADSRGEATWQWTIPLDARPGSWSMVGLGRESGMEHQIGFVVLSGAPPPPDDGGPVAQVEPAAGPPGTVFTFTATGFDFEGNERIQYWATDPAGATFSDNQGIFADNNKQVVLSWASPADALTGRWKMRIQGADSLVVVEVYFDITGDYNPPPQPRKVSPTSGPPGTTFSFVEDGFRPREQVGWWATSPTGEVYQGGVDVLADDIGRLQWQWTAPGTALPGMWMMIAQGKASAEPRIIQFEITPPTSPPPGLPPAPTEPPRPPHRVTPSSGPAGTTFTFEAEGLEPDERFGFWANAPDRTIYPGEREVHVDDNGRLVWTWTAPRDALPGDWMMVAESSTSGGTEGNTLIRIPFVIEVR